MQVRWEAKSAATPMGQLAYFIEYLTLTGLWSRWQEEYPLTYNSPNAPTKADVLGTWLLSILSGHKRYSHVTAIRCDGVNPGLLGMNKVISEDALRRALAATPEAEGVAWLDRHLEHSAARLLDAAWILDIDTTVKPLYGKQEGAVVSYNPHKPGRPAHTAYLSHLPDGGNASGAGCRSTGRRRPRRPAQSAGLAQDSRRPATGAAASPTGSSYGCRRTSSATSSVSSGMRAGATPDKAGKAKTAVCACPAGRASGASSFCAVRSRGRCCLPIRPMTRAFWALLR